MRRFFVFSRNTKPALFTHTLIAHYFSYIYYNACAKNAGRLKSFIIDRLFCNENIIPTTVQTIEDDVSTIASKA